MKTRLVALVLLCLFGSLAVAQTYELDVKSIKAQISKIRAQIVLLKAKAKTAPKSQARAYQNEIAGYQARIDKLVEKLALLERQKIAKQKRTAAALKKAGTLEASGSEGAGELIPSFEAAADVKAIREKKTLFEYGGAIGLFAASTGGLGEIRVPAGLVFGPAKSSLRLAGALVQSEDMSRRFAPVMLDLVLNFPAGWFTGVENYLGGGLNYVVKMTGQTAGTFGGQVFYGIESEGFGGKLFGEIGWAALRTGFSPSQKGTTILFGYRTPWKI